MESLCRIQQQLASSGTPVNIVCGTSYYVGPTHPEDMSQRSEKDIEGRYSLIGVERRQRIKTVAASAQYI